MKYCEWTIAIQERKRGFVASLIDPSGRRFDEPLILLPSPEAAERYAHKFINWYTKLKE